MIYKAYGKFLTEKQVETLCTKDTTGIIKGFKSKKGTDYEAKLKLDDDCNIKLVFPDKGSK